MAFSNKSVLFAAAVFGTVLLALTTAAPVNDDDEAKSGLLAIPGDHGLVQAEGDTTEVRQKRHHGGYYYYGRKKRGCGYNCYYGRKRRAAEAEEGADAAGGDSEIRQKRTPGYGNYYYGRK